MNITGVRISIFNSADEQLLAFCAITFERAFVVRDIRIIQGANGPFVAMPSRRVTTNCEKCRAKNYLGSKFCSECGTKLANSSHLKLPDRNRGFIDIAHPINAKSRERIQTAILQAYEQELAISKAPGYHPVNLDGDPNESAGQTPTPHWQSERQRKPSQPTDEPT
jgi:stage V sporulation protein G